MLQNKASKTQQCTGKPTMLLSDIKTPVVQKELSGVTGVAIPSHTRAEESKNVVCRKDKGDQQRITRNKSVQVCFDDRRSLCEKIVSLEKNVFQLQIELKEKNSEISRLSQIMYDKDVTHTRQIQEQLQVSAAMKDKLEKAEKNAQEKAELYQKCCESYEETILGLKLQHENAVTGLQKESDLQRCNYENTIQKLKQQISNIIEGKSRERQQQLEELGKEMNKLTDEANALRRQLAKKVLQITLI
ncbi:uncharacterized protein LOC114665717 [Erpetoichthys calabaricus]|uniref:uncharacterized protein LOC114665717 n=1 Tax=Erpetoichthys calabaricus TaxID=27687 RepID=UPI002234E1A4|nr:uncharacterized protein LOC114665717 [Erpetoichthys calabaricus]